MFVVLLLNKKLNKKYKLPFILLSFVLFNQSRIKADVKSASEKKKLGNVLHKQTF